MLRFKFYAFKIDSIKTDWLITATAPFYLITSLIVIRMRTLPEFDSSNLERLYNCICITCIVLSPICRNSVDQVAKEGISRAQRLGTAKKIILALKRRGAGEPAPRTSASQYERKQPWRESVLTSAQWGAIKHWSGGDWEASQESSKNPQRKTMPNYTVQRGSGSGAARIKLSLEHTRP